MILKILLVIGVIAAVYFLFFKKSSPIKKSEQKSDCEISNDMVECESCGVYTEISESILSNGKYYCSKECMEKK